MPISIGSIYPMIHKFANWCIYQMLDKIDSKNRVANQEVRKTKARLEIK